MIQESDSIRSKEEMIRWVSEMIYEINNINNFFTRKQNDYRNEFVELKNKYLTYKYRELDENNRNTIIATFCNDNSCVYEEVKVDDVEEDVEKS
jgi:hypothetical protein